MNAITQSTPRPIRSVIAGVLARIFLCNLFDENAELAALNRLKANQDADAGLEDIGLIPAEFASETMTAAEVWDNIDRFSSELDSKFEEQGQVTSRLYASLQDVLTQIDLIGIAHWGGAEGLVLANARELLLAHADLSDDMQYVLTANRSELELERERDAELTD